MASIRAQMLMAPQVDLMFFEKADASPNCAGDCRVESVRMLGRIFSRGLIRLPVDDELQGHILAKLRRLCRVPDNAELAQAAKSVLIDASTFTEVPRTWLCMPNLNARKAQPGGWRTCSFAMCGSLQEQRLPKRSSRTCLTPSGKWAMNVIP